MNPWRLIAMLEASDSSFQDLFYPGKLRCSLDERIIRAIEEHWPAYFPTRKECRGPEWSLIIRENKPLYKPGSKTSMKLQEWKKSVKGTIAEGRATGSDTSWKRFLFICKRTPRIRPYLSDFR